MSKYSPGPWIATGWKGIVVNDAEGNTLVLAPSGHKSLAECQATARLIAAAPELIESCHAALSCCALNLGELETSDLEAIRLLRNAVDKAEGRS